MNHQPFEDWLLDDKQLTVGQAHELEGHLRSCPVCSAIAVSNLALHAPRLAEPLPGFTDRFRSRLAARQRAQVRNQAIGTSILVLAGVALLYSVAGPAMLAAYLAPAAWLRDVTTQFVAVLTLSRVALQVASTLLTSVAALMPPVWAWIVLAAGSGLALLWLLMMRRLARAPRGV